MHDTDTEEVARSRHWPANTPNPGTDWMGRAKCATTLIRPGRDPYDPVGKSNTKAGRDRHAAKVCAGCPVMAECARHALYLRAEGMIRAGLCIPIHAEDAHRMPAVVARLEHIAGIAQPAAA